MYDGFLLWTSFHMWLFSQQCIEKLFFFYRYIFFCYFMYRSDVMWFMKKFIHIGSWFPIINLGTEQTKLCFRFSASHVKCSVKINFLKFNHKNYLRCAWRNDVITTPTLLEQCGTWGSCCMEAREEIVLKLTPPKEPLGVV